MAQVHDPGYGHQGSVELIEGGKQPTRHARLMQHTSVHGEGPANEPMHKLADGEHMRGEYLQDDGRQAPIDGAICEYDEAVDEDEVNQSDFAYLARSEFGDISKSDYEYGYKSLGTHNLDGELAGEGEAGGKIDKY